MEDRSTKSTTAAAAAPKAADDEAIKALRAEADAILSGKSAPTEADLWSVADTGAADLVRKTEKLSLKSEPSKTYAQAVNENRKVHALEDAREAYRQEFSKRAEAHFARVNAFEDSDEDFSAKAERHFQEYEKAKARIAAQRSNAASSGGSAGKSRFALLGAQDAEEEDEDEDVPLDSKLMETLKQATEKGRAGSVTIETEQGHDLRVSVKAVPDEEHMVAVGTHSCVDGAQTRSFAVIDTRSGKIIPNHVGWVDSLHSEGVSKAYALDVSETMVKHLEQFGSFE